nr:helix-turn-helix domain-containing protein [uncultured Faecalibacillus sp.]
MIIIKHQTKSSISLKFNMISVSFFHERSITISTNNKNLHLTDQDIIIIEKGIENGSTKAAIALTLGKDKSTIV